MVVFVVVLSACERPLESVAVEWRSGTLTQPVGALILPDAPEEALVAFRLPRPPRGTAVAASGGAVSSRDGAAATRPREDSDDDSSPSRFVVEGVGALGALTAVFRWEDESDSVALPFLGPESSTVQGRWRLVAPMPAWTADRSAAELARMEVVVRAADDATQGGRIERIVFGAVDEPAVALPSGRGDEDDAAAIVSLDWRIPVTETDGHQWEVDSLDHLLTAPTDAIILTYEQDEGVFADRRERPAVMVSIHSLTGAETPLAVRVRPGRHDLVLRPTLWGVEDPALIHISAPHEGFRLVGVSTSAVAEDPLEPIPVEASELVGYRSEWWRRSEFELFSWSLYPDILWIDSRDYGVQARMFRRLAFFVEKRGFIGTLLSDEELSTRHGWNAHNYRPEGLAAFFNEVERVDFPLTPEEEALREIIVYHRVIVRDATGQWGPGEGGVLAISQESFYELRRLLLTHEAMHGVYYQEPEFVRRVEEYWTDTLSEDEREFWRGFLSWMSYSPDDEYLMVNEFQAYLLQQEEIAVRWYFRSRIAGRLTASGGRWPEYVATFMAAHPDTFERAGAAVNQAIFEVAGLVGGDPYCIVPVGAEG